MSRILAAALLPWWLTSVTGWAMWVAAHWLTGGVA